MDTVYLNEFIVLAEAGNYHGAADQLFISQSSLSKHIQALEKELNCRLFERTAKGVILTDQGRRILSHANRIVRSVERCQQEATEQLADGETCIYVASEYRCLPRFLAGFAQKYGNRFVVDLEIGGSRSAKEALRKNTAEIGLAKAYHADDSDLFFIPFGEEQLYALLPAGHPLAERESLRLQDLSEEKLLMPGRGHSHTRNIIRACQQLGFNPHLSLCANDEESLFSWVRQGLGVAVLYLDKERCTDDSNLVRVPVTPASSVRGAVCYRKDVELSDGASLFLEYARSFPRAL